MDAIEFQNAEIERDSMMGRIRTGTGALIINADDWGFDRITTDRTLDCVHRNSVSAVSAMVYMSDSERAASLAQEIGVDAGLHFNFSQPFTAPASDRKLSEHHRRVVSYLRFHPLARVLYHPGLAKSFRYVIEAQLAEFERLYGRRPLRVDGHHHLHLCANVLSDKLLPEGTIARRNFSFRAGEKSRLNRLYRKSIDRKLEKRHRTVDFLFALTPLEPISRLERIFSLAHRYIVELETHPANETEYRLLSSGRIFQTAEDFPSVSGFGACCRTETHGHV